MLLKNYFISVDWGTTNLRIRLVSNDKFKIVSYINNINRKTDNKSKIIKNFKKNFDWKVIIKKYMNVFKKYE